MKRSHKYYSQCMRAQNKVRARRPRLSLAGRKLVAVMLRDRKFRRAARRELAQADHPWMWEDMRRFLRYV